MKSVLYAGVLGLCLTGCAATLEGLKEDLGKVGEKAGIGGDESVELNAAAPAEVEGPSVLTQIQTLLQEQGYYEGEIDGKFSAPTEAAIQDFQLDNGLRIDGRPTAELLEALQAS